MPSARWHGLWWQKPIEFGGLGIVDIDKFSRALRLCWLWYSWEQPQRPWAGTVTTVDEIDAALFAAATTVTVRNGHKALFWHSTWVHDRPLRVCFPRPFAHSRRKNRTVREALQNGTWIKDIAYGLNNELLSEFFELWNVL